MMTDSCINTGNFVEAPKLHLGKIIALYSVHGLIRTERSWLCTDLYGLQVLISIIDEHITCTIVKAIEKSRDWSLMADTTPDISIHLISEHLLACQRAPGTTAEDLYAVMMSVLQFRDVSFDKLIAQTYDALMGHST